MILEAIVLPMILWSTRIDFVKSEIDFVSGQEYNIYIDRLTGNCYSQHLHYGKIVTLYEYFCPR